MKRFCLVTLALLLLLTACSGGTPSPEVPSDSPTPSVAVNPTPEPYTVAPIPPPATPYIPPPSPTPNPAIPSPYDISQEEYERKLKEAQEATAKFDIAVEDQGDYELTAIAWLEARFEALKALPEDNMAHLEDAEIDSLDIHLIAKEGYPKAVAFAVRYSFKPTYFIGYNGYYMPGNTRESPGREIDWAQEYMEFEIRLESDGLFHLVSSGTGGVFSADKLETYDDVYVYEEEG